MSNFWYDESFEEAIITPVHAHAFFTQPIKPIVRPPKGVEKSWNRLNLIMIVTTFSVLLMVLLLCLVLTF